MAATHGNKTTATWHSQSLGEVTAIGDVNMSADTVDTSIYNATDSFKTFVRGLIDGGEVQITCNFVASDTGQTTFATDFYAGTSDNLVITFPSATGTTWTIPAIPTGLGTAQPMEDKISITLTVKVTGKPVLATTAVTGMSAIGFDNDVLIMPTFAIGRYGYENPYVVTITASETETVVTPVDATSGEVITITTDGASPQVVTTGNPSSPCTLDVDDVTQIVVTISKTGYKSKDYVFNLAVLAA